MSDRPQCREIPLTQGKVAIVDAADFEWLSQWKWTARLTRRVWYALRSTSHKTILMHRQILNAPIGVDVDHADCDGLNNRRSNLRLATACQNRANSPKRRNNTSGYIGVSWHNKTKQWQARLKVNRREISAGYSKSAEVAARMRDARALELHGEFARLNFPFDRESAVGLTGEPYGT